MDIEQQALGIGGSEIDTVAIFETTGGDGKEGEPNPVLPSYPPTLIPVVTKFSVQVFDKLKE